MLVTFNDAYDELVARGGTHAITAYNNWTHDSRYAKEVVPFVQSFDQSYIFNVTRKEFDTVKRTIESDEKQHALLGVSSSDNIPETKNLNSPWAFIQLFHRYIEEKQRVPTWLEWRDWLRGQAKHLFALPVAQSIQYASLNKEKQAAVSRGLN